MKKIYFILLTISLLIKLSYNSKDKGSYSLLDGMIKKEIVAQSLLYLPKKNNVNLLEMLLQMVNVKDEYSLNDAESAYLAFQWIAKNIKYANSEESHDPVTVYNSGKGNAQGISSLFNRICQYLEIESGSILGYVKERNSKDFVHHWNYMVIDGSYYLVDATMGRHIKVLNLIHITQIYISEHILKFLFVIIFQKRVSGNYYQSLFQESNLILWLMYIPHFLYMVLKLFLQMLLN